ncbi:MFS transporter [Actinoallomurus oryzae]|uniref:MFS transporter n=1 Tax=Actinoallomurus oryzae TaxID=502180 RepID=A0ABP8QXE8_9ACTN
MSGCRPADDGRTRLRRLGQAHALAQAGDGAFYVTSAAYLVRLGWSPVRVGILLAICWGAGALLSRRIGRLADRHGLVATSAATLGCCMAGLLGLALGSEPILVAGALLVYAGGQSAWGGLRAALVQVAADPAAAVTERARLQSIGNGAVAVGAAVGGLALGLGDIWALRVVVAGDALLYLVTSLLIARGIRISAPAPTASAGHLASAPTASADRPVAGETGRTTMPQLVATIAASALYLYMPMLSVALPLMITNAPGVPAWTISACFLANTLGVMAMQRRAAIGVTTAARTRHALLTGAALLATSSALLWTTLLGHRLAPALIVLGLGAGVVTQVLGEVRFAVGAWDLGYRLAPTSGTAAWQATYGAAIPMARSAGPALLAPLTGFELGWIVPAGLFLAGGIAMASVTTTRPAPSPSDPGTAPYSATEAAP